jgi:hypothetical protein
MTGTILGTEPAGRTFICVNIAGTQTYFSFKITSLTLKREKISVTDYFDIWRPTGLYQLRRQDSKRTIVGRKRFIELGHGTADSRPLFHQIDIIAKFGEIKSSLDTGDTTADNHH